MEKLDESKFKKITTSQAKTIIGGSNNTYCTEDSYGGTAGYGDKDVVDHRTETSDDTGKLISVCRHYE